MINKVLNSLGSSLEQSLITDSRVYLFGEDLLDPYGGAFKVTRGLQSKYLNRVFTTPISEAGFVGLAAGMALRELRPVVEIMFGDFITLAADQIINHIAKFHWMYNDRVSVPLVIRTPMGGRRGYGPTHSQTLEKIFLGIPGIKTLAPCNIEPGNLLLNAILHDENPILFIENKLLYLQTCLSIDSLTDFSVIDLSKRYSKLLSPVYPVYLLQIKDAPSPKVTLIAYGYMAEIARQAVLELAYEYEIFVDLLIPTQLSPFDIMVFSETIKQTKKLLVIEEGNLTMGWGAEIVARIAETIDIGLLVKRVAALDLPIPSSGRIEEMVLPNRASIVYAVKEMIAI